MRKRRWWLLAAGGVAVVGVALWSMPTTIGRCPGRVRAFACSARGETVAATDVRGAVRVWDADTGATLASIEGRGRALAVSPDGRSVALVGHDNTARVWDVTTGRERVAIPWRGRQVSLAAFSPDGARLVTAGDGAVRLWDAYTGQPLATLTGHALAVRAVAFRPDGGLLAVADHSRVLVWDLATKRVTREFAGSWIQCLAFAPDGNALAVGGLRTELHDLAGGGAVELEGPPWLTGTSIDFPDDLAFSPCRKSMAGIMLDRVAVWDAATGRYEEAFGPGPRLGAEANDGCCPEIGPLSLAYTRRGRLVAFGVRGSAVEAWDARATTFRAWAGLLGNVRAWRLGDLLPASAGIGAWLPAAGVGAAGLFGYCWLVWNLTVRRNRRLRATAET